MFINITLTAGKWIRKLNSIFLNGHEVDSEGELDPIDSDSDIEDASSDHSPHASDTK